MLCRAALQDRLDSFCVGLLLEDTANTVLSTRHNPPARVPPYDTPDNEVEMLRLMTPTAFSITHKKKTLGGGGAAADEEDENATATKTAVSEGQNKTLLWAYPTILTLG